MAPSQQFRQYCRITPLGRTTGSTPAGWRVETLEWEGRERDSMFPAFVGPLAPVLRFLLPLLVLAVVLYVVYRVVT